MRRNTEVAGHGTEWVVKLADCDSLRLATVELLKDLGGSL
jgi:hypothetical protein